MSTRGAGDAGAFEADRAGVELEPDPVEVLGVDAEEAAVAVEDEVLVEPAASRAACAATSFACATVTARFRSAVSIVASTSPASTSSPTATLTELTVPPVRKAAVTWSTRSTDPDSADRLGHRAGRHGGGAHPGRRGLARECVDNQVGAGTQHGEAAPHGRPAGPAWAGPSLSHRARPRCTSRRPAG